jgi:hypothetical protein
MECQQITIINISLVLCRYNSVKMSKYNYRMVEIYDAWNISLIIWCKMLGCNAKWLKNGKLRKAIIRISQHFATKLRNITNFVMLLSCDEIFAQAYLDQNFTHKGKGLLSRGQPQMYRRLCCTEKKQMIRNEVGNLRVKPLELSPSSYALRVTPFSS